jgi:hypothetical protein
MAWCLVKHRDNFTFTFYFADIIGVITSRNMIQEHVTSMGESRKVEAKRLLGRPRCRWEDNIKMDPKK